jgi:seryl-tRNA synthetase
MPRRRCPGSRRSGAASTGPLVEGPCRTRTRREAWRAREEGRDVAAILAANKARSGEIRELEAKLAEVDGRRDALLLMVPNLPHETVPVGSSASANVEMRQWGSRPAFSFAPKPHWELGAALGVLDFERATRMSGARFSVLFGAGVTRAPSTSCWTCTSRAWLRRGRAAALVNAAASPARQPPEVRTRSHLQIAGEWDLYLIPTAEVPLTNLHREEILDGRQLPLKYTAYTPCFRREAGSYGADVRGLIRQHQFDKVELVKFAAPERSHDELEGLTRDAETVLERLGLPYRRVLLCTGDMGFASAKTYDIEVWLPSQNTYREISSCSNTEAFQARRANIKYRPDGTGKAQCAHTLNGSGLAVGRALIAVLENGQQADGTVVIPEALRRYMGGIDTIRR